MERLPESAARQCGESLFSGACFCLSDLQYWESIRQPMLLEDPVSEEVELLTVEEIIEDEGGNPLTNAVPSAVILGAGDVPEEYANESVLTESTNTVSESTDEM